MNEDLTATERIVSLLRENDYTVETANNVYAAIESIYAMIPKLVIFDDLSGLVLMRHLLEVFSNINPIVYDGPIPFLMMLYSQEVSLKQRPYSYGMPYVIALQNQLRPEELLLYVHRLFQVSEEPYEPYRV